VLRALRGFSGFERLALLAITVCAGGLVLPWYRIPFASDFVRSGLHEFGWAHLALLITLASAAFLVYRVGTGRRPPLPLHEGTLLAVAGGWSAVICGYLMADRPTGRILTLPAEFGLAWGSFVSLGGAIVLMLTGLRIRAKEISREAAAPGPPVASPPRSP
jgi:hypothetical protein